PTANPSGSGRSPLDAEKTSQPSPRKAISLTNTTPIAKRRLWRRTTTVKPAAYRKSERPIAPPPTTTPHRCCLPQTAATPATAPTSAQCRSCNRATLGSIVELLEPPQGLDEAHERTHHCGDSENDRSPRGGREVLVEVPPEHGAGTDGARELEGDGHAAGIARRAGRPSQLSDLQGPCERLRRGNRRRPRCAPGTAARTRTAREAG